MNKEILLYYAIAFIVGVSIAIYFLFWGFGLTFFAVGPCTYQSFAFFCLLYGTLGVMLTRVGNTNQSIIASILISIPMVALFWLAMFSDPSPKEQIPRLLGLICPLLSALVGAIASSIIGDKIKK